ncbi:MAG: hypothetical protein ACRCST_11640 [Turicibacter sp.]
MEFFTGNKISIRNKLGFLKKIKDMDGREFKSTSGNTSIKFGNEDPLNDVIKEKLHEIGDALTNDVDQDVIDKFVVDQLDQMEIPTPKPQIQEPPTEKTFINSVKNSFSNVDFGLVKDTLLSIGKNINNLDESPSFRMMQEGALDFAKTEQFRQYFNSEEEYNRFSAQKGNELISKFITSEAGKEYRELFRLKSIFQDELVTNNLVAELNKLPGWDKFTNLLLKQMENGKLFRNDAGVYYRPKDANKINNEYHVIGYFLRSTLPKGKQTTYATKLISKLASKKKTTRDEALLTYVNDLVTDPDKMMGQSHLSRAAVINLIHNLSDDVHRSLASKDSTVGYNNINLEEFVNTESAGINISDPEMYQNDTAPPLAHEAPELFAIAKDYFGIPQDKINPTSISSGLIDHFRNVDAMYKTLRVQYIEKTHSLVNKAIREWTTVFNVSKDEAEREINFRLKDIYVKDTFSNLPDKIKSYMEEIRTVKFELDQRVKSLLSKESRGNINEYYYQNLQRVELVNIYDSYRKTMSHEDAITEMAKPLHSNLDTKTMEINYYTNKISEEFNREKKAALNEKLNEYLRTGIAPEGFEPYTFEDSKAIIENVLKAFGKDAVRSRGIKLLNRRVLYFKDYDATVRVLQAFNLFTDFKEHLLQTEERQIRSILDLKYLRVIEKDSGNEYSIADKVGTFGDVIQAYLDKPNDDLDEAMGLSEKSSKVTRAYRKYLLKLQYNTAAALANATRSNFRNVEVPVRKWYNRLSNAYYTTSLSGMIMSSVINDATAISLMASPTFKGKVEGLKTYLRTLLGNLNEDEIKITSDVFEIETTPSYYENTNEQLDRSLGDVLFSNRQLSHDGSRASQLIHNKKLAKAIIDNDLEVPNFLNKWIGSNDLSWWEYLQKHKNAFVQQHMESYILLSHLIPNFDVRDKVNARILAASTIQVPEANLFGTVIKNSTFGIPVLNFIVSSIFKYKLPMLTEATNTIRMLTEIRSEFPDIFRSYVATSIAQSFLYHSIRAKATGASINDWEKFLISTLIDSPLLGIFGDPVAKIMEGNLSALVDNQLKAPLIPLISASAAAVKHLAIGDFSGATYQLAKGTSAYTLVKNFPILSTMYRRYFLESILDFISPDNKYKYNLNLVGRSQGLTYDN